MRLETRAGMARECTYPGYYDGYAAAWAPSRCRFCPDALAEAADISVGDTWLSRFSADPAFKAGVSDVIARTPAGERLIDRLRADWLTLDAATPREMIASQSETYVYKRDICRGRRWLRGLAGRRLPDYPGITNGASLTDKWAGARNLAGELWYRALSDLRYR
jgi:coenzyme F420-reducing hydrogenase beta subunit